MKNIKPIFILNKGFTIIELILCITISSILILSSYNLFTYCRNASVIGEDYDEILLNGRYAMDYIKDEIKGADKIIASSKIQDMDSKYPQNIGFVILTTYVGEKDSKRYHYSSYYLKDNKLIRIARELKDEIYPDIDKLQGHNELCSFILNLEDINVDFENKLIELVLPMGCKDKELTKYESNIYIRCPVDY